MPGGDALLRHADAMRRHADVVDPAAAPGLERSGVGPLRVAGVGHFRHVVELKKVDMPGAQHLQAVLNVGEHALAVSGLTLGREHDCPAHVRERKADLFLAVGIGVGGVEIADAALVGRLQQPYGIVLFAALQRQTAYCGLGDDKSGRAERYFFHGNTLSFCNYLYYYTKSPEACKAI